MYKISCKQQKNLNKLQIAINKSYEMRSKRSLACVPIMAAALISNVSYAEEFHQENINNRDYLVGVAVNSSDKDKHDFSTQNAINISINKGQLNQDIDEVNGIYHYYGSDSSEFDSNINIDTQNKDFSIKIDDSADKDNSSVSSVSGISIEGLSRKLDDGSIKTVKTDFNLNADNVNIDVKSVNAGSVYGIESRGVGGQFDPEVANLDINAKGNISIKASSEKARFDQIFAVNSNNTGKISLNGASVNLEASLKTQESVLTESWIDAVNAFYGTVDIKANNANGKGVVMKAQGANNFIATIDLQNKNVGQIYKGETGHTIIDEPDVNVPTSLIVKSASDIVVEADGTGSTRSPVMGIIARHYSWIQGDLNRKANVKIDFDAAKDINVNVHGADNTVKTAGIILDVEKEDKDKKEVIQNFKGENVNIVVQAQNANKKIGAFSNVWGDDNAVGVELLNGSINIEANKDINLLAKVENEAGIIRGMSADEKTEAYTNNSGDTYQDKEGRDQLYLSQGNADATLKALGNINIGAAVGTASEIEGLSWRSIGKANFSGENVQVTATASKASIIQALEQKDGSVNFKANDTLTIASAKEQGQDNEVIYGLKVNGGSFVGEAQNIHISAKDKSDKSVSLGLYAGNAQDKKAYVTLNAKQGGDIAIDGDTFGVLASKNGDITINNKEGLDTYILSGIASCDGGSVNYTSGTGNTYTDVYAKALGNISLDMQEKSVLVGSIDNFAYDLGHDNLFSDVQKNVLNNKELNGKGTVNLNLAKDAVWNVTDNSSLDTITLNGGNINIAYEGDNKNFHHVIAKNLNGSVLDGDSGVVNLRVDLKNESKDNAALDQLVINEDSKGSYKVNIAITDADINAPKLYSENFLIKYGDPNNQDKPLSDLTFASDLVSPNGATYAYKLVFVDDQSKLEDPSFRKENNATGNNGYWHLVLVSDDSQNQEIDTIKNIGTSYGQYLAWRADLSDLRHRLGEIRYGAQSGVWAKAIYDKEKASGLSGQGFKMETYGAHFGVDKFIQNTEDASWLLGGSLRFAHSDQNNFSALDNGSGDLDAYSAKLYASYMAKNGNYADFVLSAGLYDQDITGLDNQKLGSVKADYNTFGMGVSAEVGHMFSFDEKVDDRMWYNHYFIEPQAQIAYYFINGKDFDTSTNMHVSQDNVSSLIGRIGVVAGKKFNYGDIDNLDKRYFQIAARMGFIHEFLGEQTVSLNDNYSFDADLGGTTFSYGLEGDWQFAKHQRFYVNADRETGNNYRKDLSLRVGYRYEF